VAANENTARYLRVVQVIVIPIALPGWAGEYVYRRFSRRDWEFTMLPSGALDMLSYSLGGLRSS